MWLLEILVVLGVVFMCLAFVLFLGGGKDRTNRGSHSFNPNPEKPQN